MARIAGVDLPRDKRIEIGLTYIYGIGRTSADKILAQAGVNPDIRVRDLTDDDVKKISAVIDETMTVEGDLRREIALNIKRQRGIPGGGKHITFIGKEAPRTVFLLRVAARTAVSAAKFW